MDIIKKWLSENENYDFDPQSANLVPLKETRGKLYISGMHGYASSDDFDVVISMTMVPYEISKEHYSFVIRDEISSAEKLKEILPEIDQIIVKSLQNGKKVLVHCAEGMSRSATVVLYHLINNYDKPKLFEAVKHLHKSRPIIYPNDGFLSMLYAI